MKICMVIKTLGLGGAERHVVDLSVSLKARGHDIIVCYTEKKMDDLRAELESSNIRVICLATNKHFNDFGISLRKVLQTHKPDIVHVHSPRLKFLARIYRSFYKFRLVSTYHNLFARHHPILRIGEYLSYWIDDALISCSTEVDLSMKWATTTIPNGINLPSSKSNEKDLLRRKLRIPQNDLILTCVANLLPKKNHHTLIEAFSKAFLSDQNTHLVLFGEGNQREPIEKQIDRLKLKSRIHVIGAEPNAASLAADADIFCLVSLYEGLPLALLEAMSNSLPTIVSQAGAMPSVVVDGLTGLIVDANDVSSIANAMRKLAYDPERRVNFGRSGCQRIENNYQIDSMVDKVFEVYMRSLST